MLKHRRSGRSGVCGLSNVRWLWHLERFSAPLPRGPKTKNTNISQNCAKLVEFKWLNHSQAPPALSARPACGRSDRAQHCARDHDARAPEVTAIVRDGRRVRLDGLEHGSARAEQSAQAAYTNLSEVTVTANSVQVSVLPRIDADSKRAALPHRASCLQPLH
jgi:hypothetical protein